MASSVPRAVWLAFLILAILALDVVHGAVYGLLVPLAALVLALTLPHTGRPAGRRVDRVDLAVVGALYAAVVGLFALAFRFFTQDAVAGMFLSFAGGMLLGVAGPVYYTVWRRGRPLATLGLTRHRLPEALGIGVVLAVVQFALTLWGYDLPQPVDWVPLAFLALTVGLFEAIFFRGFVQTRLEASFGPVPAVAGAATLYGAYHIGYGMGADEMVFLFGLGVVYAIAFATVRNVAVLWPLLVPLGSFFNTVSSGDITMPWMAILGFLDVLALMATVIWLAARHERRVGRRLASEPVAAPPPDRGR